MVNIEITLDKVMTGNQLIDLLFELYKGDKFMTNVVQKVSEPPSEEFLKSYDFGTCEYCGEKSCICPLR